MQKINKNIANWVMDIYLNYPYSEMRIKLCDFKERYNCSYSTMYQILPLFFDIGDLSSFTWLSIVSLKKLPTLELAFKFLKSSTNYRASLNFLLLFRFMVSTVVYTEVTKNSLESKKKNNEK